MTVRNGAQMLSRRLLGQSLTCLFVAVALALAAFLRDTSRVYERLRSKSKVMASPFGNIEYAEGGAGPHVLIVHGSGGGYDQGELIAESFLGDRFHWIAPSRFGYLRSTFHEGATFDDQAHAYAALLDALRIRQVAVLAFSHGGPSALLFATLYPERVSSLTLVSTGVVSASTGNQKQADRRGNALVTLFKYDWVYWSMTKLFKKQFMSLMGASADVVASLTGKQQEMVNRIIDGMNPVAPRSAGVMFDNRAVLPGERIADIQTPTLIFHATDDMLQRYHNAEFAEATIPGSRLVRFERGGHLLMAVEQPSIRSAIQRHILEHAAEQIPPQH
jgi:pimeloyl-ACP methyl ester carboxylesterase